MSRVSLARLSMELCPGRPMLNIARSTYNPTNNCMGDLVEMGLAEKQYLVDRHGEVIEIHWRYTGPVAIRVGGREVKPGEWV